MQKVWKAILCVPLCLCAFQISEDQVKAPLFMENFKSDSVYKKFFEPTSYSEGFYYAKDIFYYYEDLRAHFNAFKENDSIGSPVLRRYNRIGAISPSTLRWMKTSADMRSYFGPLSTFNILYMGAGYGGICKILSDLEELGNVTIVEEKGVALLCRKYLDWFGIEASFKTPDEPLTYGDYDLLLIDADFLTHKCDPDWLLEVASKVPRGLIIKRGVVDQFNPLISVLIENGREGKIKGDLFWEENVRWQLYWKPDGEFRGQPLPAEIFPSKGYQKGCAISSIVNNGRLGDHLLDYFSALWLSRIEGVPFFYLPFKYSDSFALSQISVKQSDLFLYKKKKELNKDVKDPFSAESTLWILPHTSKERFEQQNFSVFPWKFFVNWDHPEFKEEIRKHLAPLQQVDSIYPPEGYLSVALHLRKGGAYISDYEAYQSLPLHFPPDSFMIEQLKRLMEIFPNRPLYVYLFTDDLHPELLAKNFEEHLEKGRIVFDWGRNSDLPPGERVLSDFYSFQNFDCLIRPGSHFSFVGGLLGHFSLEISPSFCHEKKDGTYEYDQVQILFRGKRENVIE